MPYPHNTGSSAGYDQLVTIDRQHILHPQHHPSEHVKPQLWAKGEGIYLVNEAGERFIDGLSGMWNVSLGHGRRELIDAATRQLETLDFATAYAGSSHRPVIALSELLSEVVYPSIKAFYFTSGGGEATDTSIRTVRYFWRALGKPEKSKIIARKLSYHGSTVGSASATGVDEFSDGFGPRLPGFLHIESPYPYRFVNTDPKKTPGQAAADLLEEAILREGPQTVAAFIAEPVQGGGGGILVPQDDYFPRIREICDRYDVLLIADDVITGFGRTGRWFGLEHWGVTPDVVQFAKSITSGYFPLGGIGVSGRIKQVLDGAEPDKRWWHGYTYSGHPVGCAIAIATIGILKSENLVARTDRLGTAFLHRLQSELADHPNIGEVRGQGFLAGIEFVADRASKKTFAGSLNVGGRIKAELLSRGLCTRVLSDVVCLAPPLTASEAELDRIADIVIATLKQPFDRFTA